MQKWIHQAACGACKTLSASMYASKRAMHSMQTRNLRGQDCTDLKALRDALIGPTECSGVNDDMGAVDHYCIYAFHCIFMHSIGSTPNSQN